MTFIVSALPAAPFQPLFGLPDDVLAAQRIQRRTIDGPGSPCRLTLEDAQPGETVLLMNYEHQPADTPFRSRHAIFVREGASERRFAPGEIPPAFSAREFLSLRAFDTAGMMVDADIVATTVLTEAIDRLLANPDAAYLHAHYAGAGCYAARIDRA
ncbi:DUF1203 domain-containing protein [Phenylobacterium sp.]|uniref:DUF1203 domain-containing protein n=1 Tax=Phenylobacterium sp. TaxID=1871053 RepID=UPI003D27FAFE